VVDEYIRRRCAGKIGSKKVKPQTVRRELSYIIGCQNYCAGPHKQMFSPGLINALLLPEDGKPRERWLRDDEIEKIYAAARRLRPGRKISRIETYLHLGLNAAAREQAILDLVWDRVDWEMGTIDFDDGQRLPGDKGRAVIKMNNRLRSFMQELYAERDKSIPDSRNLVLRNKGALWATLQLVVFEAGLAPTEWVKPAKSAKPKATGISLHTLRHTAATRMCRRGVKPLTVARFLGNTLQMVLKVLVDDPEQARHDCLSRHSAWFDIGTPLRNQHRAGSLNTH
jgi:integrase